MTAPATEFFYLMGNRRDPAAVATAVTGDRALAAGLLRAAATLGCDEPNRRGLAPNAM